MKVPGAGRVLLDVRRINPQKLQDHEDKVQEVWRAVKSEIVNAKDVKINLSKLFISYTDAAGKIQYINLGANADAKYADLQRLISDVRSSVSGIWDCFKWKAKGDDASNRPIGADRPFSAETGVKKLCKSEKQFMTDGSFERLTECVDRLKNPTGSSDSDKVQVRMETKERIRKTEAFVQGLQKNVKGLIQKKKEEIGTKTDEKKVLDKKMEALDKEIGILSVRCNDLAEKANAGDVAAQGELNTETAAKGLKDKEKGDLQKEIDDKTGEIDTCKKEQSQLKRLKEELKEIDRYACYWAAGVGGIAGSKEDRFEGASAMTDDISKALSTRKLGFLGRTSLEPSAIRTYAEEVGDLIISDRLEYIERSESLNENREAAGLARRSERGSSVEGLVVMAAMNEFDAGKMQEVSDLAGFSRFESALRKGLVTALETACRSANLNPNIAAP